MCEGQSVLPAIPELEHSCSLAGAGTGSRLLYNNCSPLGPQAGQGGASPGDARIWDVPTS